MRIVNSRCAGLDVHKKTVVACVLCIDSAGEERSVVRTFDTVTRGLLELLDWLREEEVTHVAMESTGVYWKPVYNVLDGHCSLLVVNAHHVKQVPGRKTDVKDCEWLAELLQHGLLRGSFVPPPDIRDCRDLTRTRVKLIQDTTRVANRVQKLLEDANIKLASVASDVMGKSGRSILGAIVTGTTDAEALANLARGRLRAKLPELRQALSGRVRDHHRFMLELLLDQLASTEALIEKVEKRLDEVMRPFSLELTLLQTIPGVKLRTAQNILAETGPDMSRFPTAKHLASWVGISPGNNRSAGKSKNSHPAKANKWALRSLTEAGWAAAHTKDTYLAAQFRRVGRRGKKRAVLAVGHSIVVAMHHMLRNRSRYRDLGPDYFDRTNRETLKRRYERRLRKLGYDVTLSERAA